MARFLSNRQASHGTAPGSLVFMGEKKMEKTRIRVIRFSAGSAEEFEPEGLTGIPDPDPACISWINIDGIHDTELIRAVGERFGIEAMGLEDILNTDQRPRIYQDEEHLITIVKSFEYDRETKSLSSEQISFVLGKGYLITFQERIGDYFEPVRGRIRKENGRIRSHGADYLMFALLDALVDNYIYCAEAIGQNVERLEEMVLHSDKREILEEIYLYRNEIRYIRKAIRPVKEITMHYLRTDTRLISKKTIVYLTDLDDMVTQALEAVEIYYQMVTDQLNIFHTNVGNRANEVMKVLTIFATIFIPLTFITGVYGTNFDRIPELHWPNGYFYMLGLIVLVAGVMLVYFRRKKWL
ncbi:MAG: magnesium/cobalt transporter CorA [Bacteroidota bacterium]